VYTEALKRFGTIQAAADKLVLPKNVFAERLRFEQEGIPAIQKFTIKNDCYVASHMYGRMFIITYVDPEKQGRDKWWYQIASLDGRNRVHLAGAYASRGEALGRILKLQSVPTASLSKITRQRPYGLWNFNL
jgi:hypothetical protein